MNRMVWCLCLVLVAMTSVAPSAQARAQGRGTAAPPAATAASGPKAIGSVNDIMQAMVMPSSDVVFAAGADEPKTDAEWAKLRLNAVELAEAANLLMIGSRVRDRADWLKMAGSLRDNAEAVVRLASAKKGDGLSDASDKAYESCTTCHNKYWADRDKVK